MHLVELVVAAGVEVEVEEADGELLLHPVAHQIHTTPMVDGLQDGELLVERQILMQTVERRLGQLVRIRRIPISIATKHRLGMLVRELRIRMPALVLVLVAVGVMTVEEHLDGMLLLEHPTLTTVVVVVVVAAAGEVTKGQHLPGIHHRKRLLQPEVAEAAGEAVTIQETMDGEHRLTLAGVRRTDLVHPQMGIVVGEVPTTMEAPRVQLGTTITIPVVVGYVIKSLFSLSTSF